MAQVRCPCPIHTSTPFHDPTRRNHTAIVHPPSLSYMVTAICKRAGLGVDLCMCGQGPNVVWTWPKGPGAVPMPNPHHPITRITTHELDIASLMGTVRERFDEDWRSKVLSMHGASRLRVTRRHKVWGQDVPL